MFLYIWTFLQICLESLPISSSGHTLLLVKYWNFQQSVFSMHDMENFDWALHSITFLLIIIYFWSPWWHLILHQTFSLQALAQKDFWKKFFRAFLFLCMVSFIFLIFYMLLQKYQILDIVYIPLYIGFSITALELWNIHKILLQPYRPISVTWNFKHAFILGIINSIVVFIPGVSRFATNFLACILLGYSPKDSFALSWMIFLPFACVGGLYGIMQIYKNQVLLHQVLHINLVLVMVGAGLISYMLLRLMKYLIEARKISYLAWYMIVPILLSIL